MVFNSFTGSVAKNGWGRKKPGLDFSLVGKLDEALQKSHLLLNDAFAYSIETRQESSACLK
jgi:hypothetical protein